MERRRHPYERGGMLIKNSEWLGDIKVLLNTKCGFHFSGHAVGSHHPKA